MDDLDVAERLEPIVVRHPEVALFLQTGLKLKGRSNSLDQRPIDNVHMQFGVCQAGIG